MLTDRLNIPLFRYYDFQVGNANEHPSTWTHIPIKVMGTSPFDALQRFFLTSDVQQLKEFVLTIPLMVEYKVNTRNGNTYYRFKRVGEYKPDHVIVQHINENKK